MGALFDDVHSSETFAGGSCVSINTAVCRGTKKENSGMAVRRLGFQKLDTVCNVQP